MLLYTPGSPTPEARDALNNLTAQVLLRAGRSSRYALATRTFSAKRPRWVFDEVKRLLSSVAPHVEACYYCERDRHRDIDHIEPKGIHPELAFVWENYAFSCAICNQDAKRSKYAVIDDAGNLVDCRNIIGTNDNVPNGISAFINPRRESGLDFFALDLQTGIFIVRNDLDEIAAKRANFTRATLDLNNDGLTRIRRQAYHGFVRYVSALFAAVQANDAHRVAILTQEVSELGHPTVMVEAWRQRASLGPFGDMLEAIYDLVEFDRWNGVVRAA